MAEEIPFEVLPSPPPLLEDDLGLSQLPSQVVTHVQPKQIWSTVRKPWRIPFKQSQQQRHTNENWDLNSSTPAGSHQTSSQNLNLTQSHQLHHQRQSNSIPGHQNQVSQSRSHQDFNSTPESQQINSQNLNLTQNHQIHHQTQSNSIPSHQNQVNQTQSHQDLNTAPGIHQMISQSHDLSQSHIVPNHQARIDITPRHQMQCSLPQSHQVRNTAPKSHQLITQNNNTSQTHQLHHQPQINLIRTHQSLNLTTPSHQSNGQHHNPNQISHQSQHNLLQHHHPSSQTHNLNHGHQLNHQVPGTITFNPYSHQNYQCKEGVQVLGQGHQVYGQGNQGQVYGQGNQGQVYQGNNPNTPRLPVQLTPASSVRVDNTGKGASVGNDDNTGAANGGGGGGMLRPVTDIPSQYRSLFSQFPFFNIVQSTVFQDVFQSDRSAVVSAPTGSGKTVVMELALVRLLVNRDTHQQASSATPHHFRVVYMAPMKALVTERYMDWRQRLAPLNLTCAEVTGDTEHDDIAVIRNSQVILTTPEKWDFLTRRWRDHASLMQAVSLLLIDEVHVLNDEGRGPTLEAVVSRMKTIRATRPTQENSEASPRLRFVAVSATIPNVEDVAAWLSDDPSPAISHKLEESLRPVKLRRVVIGYDCRDNWTEFRFDLSLNYRLPGVIANYSENKPTLVFVSTRKGAQSSAITLSKEARLIRDSQHKQLLTTVANGLRDNKLRECLMCGVGFHHAGLVIGDRKQVEELFVASQLPVLVATSTLAMGVNLPAHLVIVKSTTQYVGGGYEEYSTAQLLQMTGRAGRPQFDSQATAVIMTKSKHKVKYENLLLGRTQLESHLHLHLAEHLNAEIVLGTVTDLGVAVEWLRSTFLYVRVQHNPRHYGLPQDLKQAQLEARLQDMCTKEVNALARAGVIILNEVDIKPTLPGRLMARYCVSFSTMKTFLQLTGDETLKDLVEIVSACQEFFDIKVRVAEKRILNDLNKSQTTSIRFPIKGKIKTREHKINCLVQATLGSENIADPSLGQETGKIFRTGQRLTKCLAEYGVSRSEYQLNLNTLLLAKCFSCRLWEDSRFVTRQLERIGPTFSAAFVQAKITSFAALEAATPRDIELILNRQPPFGNRIKDQATKLPRYEVTVEQLNQVSREKSDLRVTVRLANQEALKDGTTTPKHHSCRLLLGNADNKVVFQQKITDTTLREMGSVSRVVNVKRAENGDELAVNFISETWGGLDVQSTYTPRYLPRPDSTLKTNKTEDKTTVTTTTTATTTNTDSSVLGVGVGPGERRACLHTCGDKRNCAHNCCKVGVSAKVSSGRGEVPAVVQEVRKRTTTLPDTPVKRLKSRMESGTVDMSRFQYKPNHPIMKPQRTHTNTQQGGGHWTNTTTATLPQGHHQDLRPEFTTSDDIPDEFENEEVFTQVAEHADEFADMDAFLVDLERENLPEEYVEYQDYADAFTESLEMEDFQVTNNMSNTHWSERQITPRQQQQQQHQTIPPTRPMPRHTVRPAYRPIGPSQPTPSQTMRPQRPQGISATQGPIVQRPQVSTRGSQGLVRPGGRATAQTTLTKWLKTGQKQPPRPQTQGNVNQTQTMQPPPPPLPNSQTQYYVRPNAIGNQNQHSVRPAGIRTNQNQRPPRLPGPATNQRHSLISPTMPNQNHQPLRPLTNQNPHPIGPSEIVNSHTMESLQHAGTVNVIPNLPPRQTEALGSQNAHPVRTQSQITQNYPSAYRTQSQIGQVLTQVQDVNSTYIHPLPGTQQTVQPLQNTQQDYEGTFTPPLYPSNPSRPFQIQGPQGMTSLNPALNTHTLQTIYQQTTPTFMHTGQVKTSTEPMGWEGTHIESCGGPWQFPEIEIKQEHPEREAWTRTNTSPQNTQLPSVLCSAPPLPPTSVVTVTRPHILGTAMHQNHQQEQYQQQPPQSSLYGSLFPPQSSVYGSQLPPQSSDYGSQLMEAPRSILQMGSSNGLNPFSQRNPCMESSTGSTITHPRATSQNSAPSAPQTPSVDIAFASLESEYQSKVASNRISPHYTSNKTQLKPPSDPSSEQTLSGASHTRPVAGVRPRMLEGTASRKKEPNPFSHLTKEWNEIQRGKTKGKLSNIYLPSPSPSPSPSPRPLQRTPTPAQTPSKSDDWKDLEMFQWCRRQERLALHSLYQQDSQPEAQYPPKDLLSKSHRNVPRTPPAVQRQPRTSSLQITYDNGTKGHVVGVGLSGVGKSRQNININLSSVEEEEEQEEEEEDHEHSAQGVEEPQVRGILKKPTQSPWCVPDIYEGIE